DSIYLDYTSSSITPIDDYTIAIGKVNNSCVPEYTEITVLEAVPCTGAGHYPGSTECQCDDADPSNCSEAYYELGTQTLITFDCGGASSGDDSGDNGQNDASDGPSDGPISGGGMGTSEPTDEQDIITKPEEPEKLLKQPVREFLENLDDEKKDCYENPGFNLGTDDFGLLIDDIAAIENFLNNNVEGETINQEAAAFVKAILDDCDSDQEVDFEESLIYILPECLDDIIRDLKYSQNGEFSKVMDKFIGHSPTPTNYNWIIRSQQANGTATSTAFTSPLIDSGDFVTTTIYTDNNQDATDLSMARTFIHEAFHAYLVFKYRFSNIDKSYRNLLDKYAQTHNNNINDTHHAFFIYENLISEIATALQKFGNKNNYSLPSQFYQDMAWGGLTHYRDSSGNLVLNPAFVQYFPNQSDRQRILNTLAAELTGQNGVGIVVQGSKACP
ncbi:MAG: hypothetical protein RI535_02420, partial [Psychroflexus sp.]|nr:hypothetical protein [Psychroflexus sp.]